MFVQLNNYLGENDLHEPISILKNREQWFLVISLFKVAFHINDLSQSLD